MFRPKDLLPDPKRFPKERFGFGVLAHRLVQQRQIVQDLGGVGMFGTQNLPPDPERFLVERLCFGIVADLFEKEPEVIQGFGGLGVLRTPSAFATSTALSAVGIAS